MSSTESGYSRKNPFPAKLSVNRKLTGEGSNKETRHFEIELNGSGLAYEVGDSLGVFASNNPTLVELVLKELGFSGEEMITTAFSRDQAEKIYVQHRMLENGAEIFEWLQRGGFFYVCGDAKHMAKDVDSALHTIAEKHGNMTHEKAKEYVENLKKEKRYRKDVY